MANRRYRVEFRPVAEGQTATVYRKGGEMGARIAILLFVLILLFSILACDMSAGELSPTTRLRAASARAAYLCAGVQSGRWRGEMDRNLRAALFFFALFVALVVVAILTCGSPTRSRRWRHEHADNRDP